MIECKGRNCESADGISHSRECIRDHDEAINPDKAVIRKAIERYCDEVRDPRAGFTMITNASDMLNWLLEYDSEEYDGEVTEVFPGTRDDLMRLRIK